MNRKGPETWLSRGLEISTKPPSQLGDSEDSSDEPDASGDAPTQSSQGARESFAHGAAANSDPYLPVSSHWMAPGKNFLRTRSSERAAERDHLIRIETERAVTENLEIERQERPEETPDEIG